MALGHRDSDKGRDGVIKGGETHFRTPHTHKNYAIYLLKLVLTTVPLI